MTRTEAALALAGGAIGGAAAIGGMWIGRRLLTQPIVAAPAYDQATTVARTISRLTARRKEATS